MKKLTGAQEALLKELHKYMSANNPMKYDTLKAICECKTFDSTFNALLEKGRVERVETNDFSNQFRLA